MIDYYDELQKVKRKQELFIMENGFESTTYKILIEFYKEGADKK